MSCKWIRLKMHIAFAKILSTGFALHLMHCKLLAIFQLAMSFLNDYILTSSNYILEIRVTVGVATRKSSMGLKGIKMRRNQSKIHAETAKILNVGVLSYGCLHGRVNYEDRPLDHFSKDVKSGWCTIHNAYKTKKIQPN